MFTCECVRGLRCWEACAADNNRGKKWLFMQSHLWLIHSQELRNVQTYLQCHPKAINIPNESFQTHNRRVIIDH